MNNLKNTRKKLAVIFTIIIAILFLIIANAFFGFKFITDKNIIEDEYKNVEKIIESQTDNIVTFLDNNSINQSTKNEQLEEIDKILDFTNRLFNNTESKFDEFSKTKNIEDVLIEGKSDFPFFNHKIIVFDKDEIIYSNIEDNENIDFKKYFNYKDSLIYEKELIVLKTKIGDKQAFIFNQRKYSNEQMLWDMLYSFIGILFFSIIFYFIGKIFVTIALKPVEENIISMNDFIDNAGHELKTPLAAINSSANLLKEIKKYESELVNEIIDETRKSNEIIGALRDLTQISKNSKIEDFSVISVIKEVVASMKINTKKNNIVVNIDENNDIKLKANKDYFYILISNIISNSIKYNKKDGTVNIEIGENYITINDSGIGIPKKQINKIFERFYRVKNHKNISGYGLGLSMAEKICKIYNWKIQVESIELIGTKVKINL